nr:MAG TPA: Protein of unknown function (DUF1492) [Caudoviricetes sp.]
MSHTWTPDNDTPRPDSCADYRAVKAWFQQCRDGEKAIAVQRAKIAQLRLLTTHITPSMTGMPMAPGNGDKVGAGAASLVDERRQLQRMETDLCNLRLEATRRAYCLTEIPECARAICDYYINGKTQPAIAQEEDVFDTSVIRRRIKRGFSALAEIWVSFDENKQK